MRRRFGERRAGSFHAGADRLLTGAMKLLYDLPIPLGEPHYAQMISADKIKALEIYKPVGTNPLTDSVDPNASQTWQPNRRSNSLSESAVASGRKIPSASRARTFRQRRDLVL